MQLESFHDEWLDKLRKTGAHTNLCKPMLINIRKSGEALKLETAIRIDRPSIITPAGWNARKYEPGRGAYASYQSNSLMTRVGGHTKNRNLVEVDAKIRTPRGY